MILLLKYLIIPTCIDRFSSSHVIENSSALISYILKYPYVHIGVK